MNDSQISLPGSEERPDAAAENESLMRPGRVLAARREELGMTVEQAASQLNLAPRQVQAIEAENYAALPGMASARGFMRAYAKLLKIEPEPLLAAVANETAASDETLPLRRALPAKPFAESRLIPNERKRVWPLIGLALLLAVFALIAGERMGWLSILPPSVAALMNKEVARIAGNREESRAASAALPAGVDAGRPANAVQSLPAPAAEFQHPAAPGQGQADANGAAAPNPPADAGGEAKAADASAAQPAPAGQTPAERGKQELTLKLREDSWINIRKPDNSVLISRLVKAGSTESFALDGPVSVVIGNANGVDAALRGEPLDLKAKAKNNVARLKLK